MSLAGRDYAIPPLPAGPWLEAILSPGYRQIVPGLMTGLAVDDLLDRMVSGQIRAADIDEVAREAISEVSGMRWWSATRLASWLVGNWDALGSAVLAKGMRMDRDPLGAVLVVTYRVIQESQKDEAERRKVDLTIDQPPPGFGISADEMFDQQAATQAFMALAGAG